jgi:hypothetical protein
MLRSSPEEITLRTHLSVEDCVTRLKESTEPERFLSRADVPFLGPLLTMNRPQIRLTMRESGFRLRKQIYYRNSGSPLFYGKLNPDAERGGTTIIGHFELPLAVRVSATIWLVMYAVTGIPAAVICIRRLLTGDHSHGSNQVLGLAIVCSMGVAYFAISRLCRLLGSRDEGAILDFMKQTLIASPDCL